MSESPTTETSVHLGVRVAPEAHELEITLRLSGFSGPISLELPTWVPGAYGFMKYARDLFSLRARDARSGADLAVARSGWQGFLIETGAREIELTYRAFAHDAAWGELAGIVDHEQGVLLGTRYLHALAHTGPITVEYQLPEGWQLHHPAGAELVSSNHSYRYPSYSVLLDTPVVIGKFEQRTRESFGKRFDFIFLDRAIGFDSELDPFIDSVMAIASRCHSLFGSYPFDSYSFIFTFNPKAGWGLEHANATQIALEPDALIDAQHRFDGLRVCAHELFHAWNVCRLKPAPLGTPDHSRGSFSDALWVAEGFTRYYEFVLTARAGESSASRFFSNVINYYRHLTSLPACGRVSAVDSSLTTFLNHNRYPGSVNNTVDYYDLGMLIAFDLDASLRLEGSSLDAEFSLFYQERAGRGAGFTSAELGSFLSSRRPQLERLYRREVWSAGTLSTELLLSKLGFELQHETHRILGLVLQENKGPSVADVLDDGPASAAGIAPGDELIQLNGYPFQLNALRWLIARRAPLHIEVLRGHRRFVFEVASVERRRIGKLLWSGTEAQAELLRAWLGAWDVPGGSAVPLTDYDNFHGVQTVL